MHGVFGEFALLLRMSAAAGTVSLWLRQPVLIAHIVIGFLIILAMGKGRVEAVVEELLLGSVTKHVLAESAVRCAGHLPPARGV